MSTTDSFYRLLYFNTYHILIISCSTLCPSSSRWSHMFGCLFTSTQASSILAEPLSTHIPRYLSITSKPSYAFHMPTQLVYVDINNITVVQGLHLLMHNRSLVILVSRLRYFRLAVALAKNLSARSPLYRYIPRYLLCATNLSSCTLLFTFLVLTWSAVIYMYSDRQSILCHTIPPLHLKAFSISWIFIACWPLISDVEMLRWMCESLIELRSGCNASHYQQLLIWREVVSRYLMYFCFWGRVFYLPSRHTQFDYHSQIIYMHIPIVSPSDVRI